MRVLLLQFYKKSLAITISCLLCFSIEAENLSHPFFLSQAGSGGASLREDMSYLINPSLLGFQKRTKGAISYSFKKKQQSAIASFLDLQTKLPMAISYQRLWSHSFKESAKDQFFVHSGFRVSPYFSLGARAQRGIKQSDWNFGLAGTLRLNSTLALALFLDEFLDYRERILSVALYHQWRRFFSTQIDLSRTEQKIWILKGGLRSLFHPYFSVQLGGRTYFEDNKLFNKIEEAFLSAGLSFHSPRLVLEYGLETNQKNYQHSLTLLLRI